MKQIELTNYEFENQGMSRLMALSGISGPPGFHYVAKNQQLISEMYKTLRNV